MNEIRNAFLELKKYRNQITRQQVRTLAGQIKSGQIEAAMKGIDKIIKKRGEINGASAQRNRSKAV